MSGLSKPEKGSGRAASQARRFARRLAARKAKRKAARDEALIFAELRRQVWERDGRRCRVCGTSLALATGNPFVDLHAHHVVFRSQGGTDDLSNLVSLCHACHEGVHQHRVEIGPETLT